MKIKIFLLRYLLPIVSVAVVAFVVDQIAKRIVFFRFLYDSTPITLLPIFKIQLIYNYGVSFSFLNGANIIFILLTSAIALILVLVLLYFMFGFQRPLIRLAVGLIIGAALSNMYDRVVFGAVIDYLYFHIADYSFPIFNFADVFITFSAIILILDLYILRRRREKNNNK